MKTKKMHCWSCEKETIFTDHKNGEGFTCDCGHMQDSYEQGAKELCEVATWHDLDDYRKMAEIAKQGGYSVPETPKYY